MTTATPRINKYAGKCRDCGWVGTLCHKRSLAKGDADVHRNYWDQA